MNATTAMAKVNLAAVLIMRSSRREPERGVHDHPRNDGEVPEPSGGPQPVHIDAVVLTSEHAAEGADEQRHTYRGHAAGCHQQGEEHDGERRFPRSETDAAPEVPEQVE